MFGNLFKPLEFEELTGGLRTKIIPNRNHHDHTELSDESNEEIHCFLMHEFDNLHWEFEDDRRHYTLYNQAFLDYFPAFYAQPRFPHKITQFDWNLHINKQRPCYKYLQTLNQSLSIHIKEMMYHLRNGNFFEMDNFSLASSLYNISWIDPVPRRMLYIYMAHFLRQQSDLKNILCENAFLRHENGFRLLLTFSLTVGESVVKLYLWNFFFKGVMPLDIGYKEHMKDPFILTKDLKKRVADEEKQRIWKEYLMDEKNYNLPQDYFYFYTIFLKSFVNLVTLYINYTWVALGQGVSLNLLSCIRNGRLRDLYLLCNSQDMPYNSGCRVSCEAWLKAKQMSSNKLNIHLVIKGVGACYDDIVTLLQDGMPLASFLLNTGLPIVNYHKVKEPWFDCILRTIIHKYKSTLKRLYVETWFPRQRVDAILAKCLTDLPLIEEFVYNGNLDKLDTINEMCDYLLHYSTRLKYLKIKIHEDPCSAKKYRNAVSEIESVYKNQLYGQGIQLCLGTQII